MIQHLCNDVTIHLMPTASPLLILKHPPILECFLSPLPIQVCLSPPDQTRLKLFSGRTRNTNYVKWQGEARGKRGRKEHTLQ